MGGTETVLVGEDNELTRGFTERALQTMGYTVIVAGGPEEVLAMFGARGEGIDLAILDVVMPGKNGHELARELRARRPAMKILFVSGYPAGMAPGGERLPDEDFLAKPFSPTQLGRKVREVLDGARARGAS